MFQDFLQNAFIIRFGLTVRDHARWYQVLNGGRATKRKPAGVYATAIRASQNFPNRNAVSTERFGGKIDLFRAVSWREPPYPFLNIDVSVAQ